MPCNGEIVSEVVIRSHAPAYGGLFQRSLLLGHLVTALHVATAPSVIRTFILLKPGARCSIVLRRETERILRALPFIADAAVTAYPDGPRRVRIEVVTIDEPEVLGTLVVHGTSPYLSALTLGNTNVTGSGIYAAVGWRDGLHYRDTYSANLTAYRLLNRPYQVGMRAERDDHGYWLSASVSRPFFTQLQPYAWRLTGGGDETLVPFRAPGRPTISLSLRREYFDAGAGVRIGTTSHPGLLGLSLSTERETPASDPLVVTDTGVVVDTTDALLRHYRQYRTTRLNLLAGYRHVNFLRVTGFDALAGAQDVKRGFQFGMTLGRGLPVAGAVSDELFAAADVYGGVGSAKSFIGLQVNAEGRRSKQTDAWDGLLTGGRLALYLEPHPRHTVVGSLEFGAGERQRIPFQLALGDVRGGVRGYRDAQLGGAERVVGRLEERWRVGSVHGTADAGLAVFTDVGKLWAGDVPLGQDTPLEPSVGVGLLAAVPPGSQRLWRLDVAVPLRRAPGNGRWELRFSAADLTRDFYHEPHDVRTQHERTVPASVFTWP